MESVKNASPSDGYNTSIWRKAIENDDISTIEGFLKNKDLTIPQTQLNPSFLRAVFEGKIQLAKLLLKHGVCLNANARLSGTALVGALQRGKVDSVRFLLRRGAHVDSTDWSSKTVLMVAAENMHSMYRMIHYWKANLNLQDLRGKTALMFAVDKCNYDGVQLLFNAHIHDVHIRCNEDIRDKEGNTALDFARRNGTADVLCLMSEARKKGQAALSLAAQRNDLELVRKLLKLHPGCIHGSDSILTEAMHGDQKVWDGNICCSLELMACLLEAGVNVNDRHDSGLTPLMLAASAGSYDAVKLLLSHKADVNQTAFALYWINSSTIEDPRLQSPLWCSLQGKNYAVTNLLVQHGANVNFHSSGRLTVLMQALKNCPVGFAELLITNGANVNAQDNRGNTALVYALHPSVSYRTEKVSLLLKYDATITNKIHVI